MPLRMEPHTGVVTGWKGAEDAWFANFQIFISISSWTKFIFLACVGMCKCVGGTFEGFKDETIKVKGLVKDHFFDLSTTREENLN